MARRTRPPARPVPEDASLLDVLDTAFNKGVVVDGDLVLGVANVDLVYVKLSALVAAIDRVVDEPFRKGVAAGPRERRRRR